MLSTFSETLFSTGSSQVFRISYHHSLCILSESISVGAPHFQHELLLMSYSSISGWLYLEVIQLVWFNDELVRSLKTIDAIEDNINGSRHDSTVGWGTLHSVGFPRTSYTISEKQAIATQEQIPNQRQSTFCEDLALAGVLIEDLLESMLCYTAVEEGSRWIRWKQLEKIKDKKLGKYWMVWNRTNLQGLVINGFRAALLRVTDGPDPAAHRDLFGLLCINFLIWPGPVKSTLWPRWSLGPTRKPEVIGLDRHITESGHWGPWCLIQ